MHSVREIQLSYLATDVKIEDNKITSAESVRDIFADLENADREKFCVLHLTSRNRVIGFEVVSIGTLTESLVSPACVLKSALLNNAKSLVLVHNHPSGETSPSPSDKTVTRLLINAAKLFDIAIFDHIIIGHDGEFFSFAANGLM